MGGCRGHRVAGMRNASDGIWLGIATFPPKQTESVEEPWLDHMKFTLSFFRDGNSGPEINLMGREKIFRQTIEINEAQVKIQARSGLFENVNRSAGHRAVRLEEVIRGCEISSNHEDRAMR